MKVSIAKDGYFFIFFALFFGILFIYLGKYSVIFYIFAGVAFLKLVFFCYFFRDPTREIKIDENAVLSPADGTVLEITEEDNFKIIRIFLSIFNVHIQRSPISGILTSIENKKGKFLPAMKKEAHSENEQQIFTIKAKNGQEFKVYQIAGILARRLVSWVEKDQEIKQGEKIGIIKFGSQVDIAIPKNFNVIVKVGDKVAAGLTRIAQK